VDARERLDLVVVEAELVEVLEVQQPVDLGDLVLGEVERLELRELGEVRDLGEEVLLERELLEVYEAVEAVDGVDLVVGEHEHLEVRQLVEVGDLLDLEVREVEVRDALERRLGAVLLRGLRQLPLNQLAVDLVLLLLERLAVLLRVEHIVHLRDVVEVGVQDLELVLLVRQRVVVDGDEGDLRAVLRQDLQLLALADQIVVDQQAGHLRELGDCVDALQLVEAEVQRLQLGAALDVLDQADAVEAEDQLRHVDKLVEAGGDQLELGLVQVDVLDLLHRLHLVLLHQRRLVDRGVEHLPVQLEEGHADAQDLVVVLEVGQQLAQVALRELELQLVLGDDEVVVDVVVALRVVVDVVLDDRAVDLAVAVGDGRAVDVLELLHQLCLVLDVGDLVDGRVPGLLLEDLAVARVAGDLAGVLVGGVVGDAGRLELLRALVAGLDDVGEHVGVAQQVHLLLVDELLELDLLLRADQRVVRDLPDLVVEVVLARPEGAGELAVLDRVDAHVVRSRLGEVLERAVVVARVVVRDGLADQHRAGREAVDRQIQLLLLRVPRRRFEVPAALALDEVAHLRHLHVRQLLRQRHVLPRARRLARLAVAEAVLDNLLQLVFVVGLLALEEVLVAPLQLALLREAVRELVHLDLLELVGDLDDLHDFGAADALLLELELVEAVLEQVLHELLVLVARLALLETDVPARLQLRDHLPFAEVALLLAGLEQVGHEVALLLEQRLLLADLLVDQVLLALDQRLEVARVLEVHEQVARRARLRAVLAHEDGVEPQVVALLELELLTVLQHLDLVVELVDQHTALDVPALAQRLGDLAGVALDGLDAHVLVHLLLHEGRLGLVLALLADHEAVELLQVGQVLHHEGRLVVQRADRVVALHRVVEAEAAQVGQLVHRQDLLEVPNIVASQVDAVEVLQARQALGDDLDLVPGQLQLAQVLLPRQRVEVLDPVVVQRHELEVRAPEGVDLLDAAEVGGEALEVREPVQRVQVRDQVVVELELAQEGALLHLREVGQLAVQDAQRLQVLEVDQELHVREVRAEEVQLQHLRVVRDVLPRLPVEFRNRDFEDQVVA